MVVDLCHLHEQFEIKEWVSSGFRHHVMTTLTRLSNDVQQQSIDDLICFGDMIGLSETLGTDASNDF